jgi:hypothetical protein
MVDQENEPACYAPKFALVVVAHDDSRFIELAIVAMHMLRKTYPHSIIEILTDATTYRRMQSSTQNGIQEVSKFHVIECVPSRSAMIAYELKALSRKIIKGKFVLIDVDAILLDSLPRIFDCSADVAAVLDRHCDPDNYTHPAWETRLFDELKWPLPRPYYNTGFLLFNDTSAAQRLGDEWLSRWQAVRDAKIITDQPAFNAAVGEVQPKVCVLPAEYNCQFPSSWMGLREARVLHFFDLGLAGRPEDADTVLEYVVARLALENRLDLERLDQLCSDHYPWMNEWFRALVSCGLYKRAFKQALKLAVKRVVPQ